jgi:hypothetical protein
MIDAGTFDDRIVRGVPAWFLSMIRTTSEKIRKANSRLETLQSSGHSLHVVLALQYYFLRYGSESPFGDGETPGDVPSSKKSLDVSQTVQQLVQLLSVSTQCVMQVLDTLQKKGMIDVQDGRVLLCDQAKLDGCCDYLRLMFRKAFEKMTKPSTHSSDLVLALADTVASAQPASENRVEISGADMAAACERSGVADVALETVNELKQLGIVSYVKQDAVAKDAFAGYQFFVDPAGFGKLLLYCSYKDMVP